MTRMHEYSIVQALIERIDDLARTHRATAVSRVRVKVGRLAGVDPALLRTAYDVYRVRTICDGAPLDIAEIEPVWLCAAGHGPIAAGGRLSCASCGGPARMAAGDEIILDGLDLEVGDV
jgi:hydrogenase nickel incorporation protein HypA/HybF